MLVYAAAWTSEVFVVVAVNVTRDAVMLKQEQAELTASVGNWDVTKGAVEDAEGAAVVVLASSVMSLFEGGGLPGRNLYATLADPVAFVEVAVTILVTVEVPPLRKEEQKAGADPCE